MQNSQRKYSQKLKKQAFSILGNKCQHCGEEDSIVLSVDHINPIGKHRKPSLQVWSYIKKHPKEAIIANINYYVATAIGER